MELNLTTERLFLRPLDETDIDISIELWTDPAVVKFVCEVSEPEHIEEEFPAWLKRGAGGAIGIWCVTDKATGEKLGSCYLLPLPIDQDDTDYDLIVPDAMPDAEIETGYFLKPGAWGRGIATETCRRMLRFAFEATELDEVVSTFQDGHDVSRNVLLKCGFMDHGRRRAYAEEMSDFRITREQWQAAQQGA